MERRRFEAAIREAGEEGVEGAGRFVPDLPALTVEISEAEENLSDPSGERRLPVEARNGLPGQGVRGSERF